MSLIRNLAADRFPRVGPFAPLKRYAELGSNVVKTVRPYPGAVRKNIERSSP